MLAAVVHGLAVFIAVAFVGVMGLVALAGELARIHFNKGTVLHDEQEVVEARDQRRRGDFGDCSEFG
jgi:hypothetical protein